MSSNAEEESVQESVDEESENEIEREEESLAEGEEAGVEEENQIEEDNFEKSEEEAIVSTVVEEGDEDLKSKDVLQEILGAQFCYGELPRRLEEMLEQTDPLSKKTYGTLFKPILTEAKTEQKRIYQEIMSKLSCYSSLLKKDELTLSDALVQRAEEILQQHRVVDLGLVAHNFHTLIVGPRHSGKSLMLGLITERFLQSLMLSQGYKTNFVVLFDAKKLAEACNSFVSFYEEMVDLLFSSLSTQRPGFQPFASAVVSYFKGIGRGVTDGVLPRQFVTNELFKNAARSLYQLGSQLIECYGDSGSFEQWHTNVLLMPRLIATSFGFSQVHFIVDNVEYLNCQLQPEFPFTDSKGPIDLAEFFQYAMWNASYLVACESFEEFVHSFGPRKDSINIIASSTFVDVFGLDGDFQGRDKAFMVRFEGDPRLFKFSSEDCCGCPAYLSVWEEICREADLTRNLWNVPVDEYDDQQATVREYLSHLFQEVFIEDDSEDSKLLQNEIVEIRPITSIV